MKDEQKLSRVERKKREQAFDQEYKETSESDAPGNEGDSAFVEDAPSEGPDAYQSPEGTIDQTSVRKESDQYRKKRGNARSLFRSQSGGRKRPKREQRPDRTSSAANRGAEDRKPEKVKRQRKWKGKAFMLFLLLFILVGYLATSPFTFLVMGSDARVGESLSGSRTDSLQLMEFVPRSRTVQNVSIPRDTYTAIPCEPEREGDKITHAFAYGGADCTIGAVEGLTNATIDGQVVITFESFMELIDLIGGVNVTATHTFSEKGFNQTYEYTEGVSYAMDGDMALAYARHRKSDTDGARSNRQTEVMTAVAEKLASPSGWTKIPATYRFMKEEMGLEMNVLQMASVGLTMIMSPEVNKMQVEGQDAYINNVYYYQPAEESVKEIQDALDLTIWGTTR